MSNAIASALSEFGSYTAGTDGASTARIYEGEGTNLSARIASTRRRNTPAYRTALREAQNLYGLVLKGDPRAKVIFTEQMSTSDFSFLFGDIIDRQMLARYASAPVQWDMIAKRGRVRDFRTVKRFTLDGGEAVLTSVAQQTEYPAAKLVDGAFTYSVTKYGRRIPLDWETLLNDDLDAFRDMPDRLGNAARRSEERFATALYASSTGPNSTFFSSGNKNVMTDNHVLSIQGLQSAYTVLASQVDTDGAPIYVDGTVLVIPPALEVIANNIIHATEIVASAGGGPGTGRDQVRADNWMRNRVKIMVNPWLPIIDTTHGTTAWYLFADPNVGRPAMEVGFLLGHETPELFQKTPNAVRVGGGLIGPEEGDFDTDSVEWKVRHVFGGTLMDPKSAVGSTGVGADV